MIVRMKNELRKNSSLLIADLQKQHSTANGSGSSINLVDVNKSTHSIQWEGQAPDDKFVMTQANIDLIFLTTTGMKLIAGRSTGRRY